MAGKFSDKADGNGRPSFSDRDGDGDEDDIRGGMGDDEGSDRDGDGDVDEDEEEMQKDLSGARRSVFARRGGSETTVVDGDVLFAQITKAVNGAINAPAFITKLAKAVAGNANLGDTIRQEVTTAVAPLRKAGGAIYSLVGLLGDHTDELHEEAMQKSVTIEKALEGIPGTIALVKALTEKAEGTAGGGGPVAAQNGSTPTQAEMDANVQNILEKSLGGGMGAFAPHTAAKPEDVMTLVKKAESLQEDLHKAVDGLSEVTIAMGSGQVSTTLLKALSEGIEVAEKQLARR